MLLLALTQMRVTFHSAPAHAMHFPAHLQFREWKKAMLTMTSQTVYGKHVTKGWLTFSSPLNDEWLKKCIFFCIRDTVNNQKFCLLAFFGCLLVNCLVGGGGRRVGELGIILLFLQTKSLSTGLMGSYLSWLLKFGEKISTQMCGIGVKC